MLDWLRRPEYEYLLAFLREAETSAVQTALAAKPENSISIAKAQTEAKVLAFFTTGLVAKAITQELAQWNKKKQTLGPN
jgi:hypothetical protein